MTKIKLRFRFLRYIVNEASTLAIITHNIFRHDSLRFYTSGPSSSQLFKGIQRINHYPADSMVRFVNTYSLDSDLSTG